MTKTPTPRDKTPKAKGSTSSKSTIKKNTSTKSSAKRSESSPRPPPILSNDGIIYRKNQLEHYSFIDLVPRTDVFSEPHQPKGNWRVQIGDYACIQSTSRDVSFPPGLTRKTPPFNTQWRPCQILSIYRERPSKLKMAWDPVKVEVRWFYRILDLDSRNLEFEKANKMSKDEILESGHVAVLDATLLLGKLVLRHFDGEEEHKTDVPEVKNLCYRYYLHEEKDILQLFDKEGMVTRGLECSKHLQQYGELKKRSYQHLDLRIPENEGSGGNSKDQNMINLPPHSLHVKYKEGEKAFYSSCFLTYPWSMLSHRSLICPIEKRGDFPKWQLVVGDVVAVPCNSSKPPCGEDKVVDRDKWYPYSQPWSHAQVIAIYRNGVSKSGLVKEKDLKPVLASDVQVRIRWLNRLSEAISELEDEKKIARLQKIAENRNRITEVIFEGKELSEISCDFILGPVRIDDQDGTSPRKKRYVPSCENDSPISAFMIQNRRVVESLSNSREPLLLRRGLSTCDLFTSKAQAESYRESIISVRKKRMEEMKKFTMPCIAYAESKNEAASRSANSSPNLDSTLQDSGTKCLPQKRLFYEKSPAATGTSSRQKSFEPGTEESAKQTQVRFTPKVEVHSANDLTKKESFEEIQRVFCRKKPFHVDVSSMKSFYTEIEIKPPLDSYDVTVLSKIESSQRKTPWVVKMGDTISLEIESGTKAASHYPFNVAWAPAEIVAIFHAHKSKDSCIRLRESLEEDNMIDTLAATDSDGAKDIQLEVRWLYRMHEIPGVVGKASLVSSRMSLDLEEIFETDHLDYCTADSILSPVLLHENNHIEGKMNDVIEGLPCIHYHCARFWSLHRKSFITSGSLLNRATRGRMYSDCFGKHGTASAALKRLEGHEGDSESSIVRHAITWQEAFRSAIRTLSLAEAAHDVQLRGARLPCRDKERKDMSDFLKTAICGVTLCKDGIETSMAVKSSMFVAGPPGTGECKTATLRSVIRELQEQQASGEVPEFKYIELNGMELRNPYDAYVKFWEAISGIKKEKLPPGQAAACLDKYFCEEADDYGAYTDEIDRRPVTVLLLDEIDYLVTEKETVLYSFFDWPLRAVPTAKLIVIGIANTLNLPEKLSPKLSSRMGQKRMFFAAYDTNEIVTIIKKRLGMEGDVHDPTRDVFDIDAIRFAARKTANRSGDIRKAFQICKAAAERVYEASLDGSTKTGETRPIVSTQDVMRASNDMFSSVLSKAISCSSNFQACLLIAIGSLMKGGMEEARFPVRDIRAKMVSIADASGDERYDGVTCLDHSTVLYMITRSAESGILNLTYPSEANNSFPLVGTHLNPYEINQAFKHTYHSTLACKHLTETFDF